MSKSTISTFELFQMFPDAEAARVYMEGKRWPDGAVCPACDEANRITTRKGGFYRCTGIPGTYERRVWRWWWPFWTLSGYEYHAPLKVPEINKFTHSKDQRNELKKDRKQYVAASAPAEQPKADDGFDTIGFAVGLTTGIPLSPSKSISMGSVVGAMLHENHPSKPAPAAEPPAPIITSTPEPSSSSSSSYSDSSSSDYSSSRSYDSSSSSSYDSGSSY